jgi:hypothetical protein
MTKRTADEATSLANVAEAFNTSSAVGEGGLADVSVMPCASVDSGMSLLCGAASATVDVAWAATLELSVEVSVLLLRVADLALAEFFPALSAVVILPARV